MHAIGPDIIKAQITLSRQHEIDHHIESCYRKQIFPDVSGLFGGDIILRC